MADFPSTLTQTEEELVLRVSPELSPEVPTQRHVQFAPGVLDNENLNKKKSKICCIYRKPHNCDDTESDSSDDDQDRNGYERKPKYKK